MTNLGSPTPPDFRGEPWRATSEAERQKLAHDEFSSDTRHGGSRYCHLIVLNDYQIANLRALLYAVESGEIGGWNTGDWVGEIPWRLPAVTRYPPNRQPKPMRPTKPINSSGSEPSPSALSLAATPKQPERTSGVSTSLSDFTQSLLADSAPRSATYRRASTGSAPGVLTESMGGRRPEASRPECESAGNVVSNQQRPHRVRVGRAHDQGVPDVS